MHRGRGHRALEWCCADVLRGGYSNTPQQIGAAISEDGLQFRRLNRGLPLLPAGPTEAWNGGESGHPFVFVDDDGRMYLFFQGDNPARGYRWRLSMLPLHLERRTDGDPVIRLDGCLSGECI